MQKITTFLTFDNQAEEAIHFYASVFPDSSVNILRRYGAGAPLPEGTLMTATFELAGQTFMALNAGPHFSFSQGISLFVTCNSQEEVDDLWHKLSEGGEPQVCGWLKDKYGVSWQIIPAVLGELMFHSDAATQEKAMQAMMKMDKINIQQLKDAIQQ
jgi:predicted 3-demethylubiquinone-9 3-methyltransferase (glyoxalase superfamily)